MLTVKFVYLQASMVCVPQAFVEYELRVYDKRKRAERNKSHQKALEWVSACNIILSAMNINYYHTGKLWKRHGRLGLTKTAAVTNDDHAMSHLICLNVVTFS